MVFHALLICSDQACSEEIEAYGMRLEELEAIACECGCALQVIAWSEAADDAADARELQLDRAA